MTIESTTNKARFLGDGSNTVFPFSFPIPSVDDLFVYYTNPTGVTVLLDPSTYSVAITAVSEGTPLYVGTVTYLLSGSPIPLSSILVLLRTVPYDQTVDLVNQDGFYPEVVESGLDNLEMQIQQLVEVQGRNLTVGVTDTSPGTLPSAAERANQLLGFDASGNAIAAQPSSAPVSTAMQPVVAASTLALARTALGLGAAATEGIGSGLQDDGAGNLRTFYKVVQDGGNQTVTALFHANSRLASGAISYALPKADTLWNGFGFWVSALSASVSILVNAADNFDGIASGQTLIIPPGTQAFISTDGAATGLWSAAFDQLIGTDSPLNLRLNASVLSNAMTIAVKDRNGLDPSATSPVLLAFRDPTVANGNPVIRAITSSLSLTIPNTATLGSTSGNQSRVWIVAIDNAGTVLLAAIVCSTATQIFPLLESSLATTNSGGVTAGQFYAPTVVAAKAFRVLGYVESTQVTAGTWAAAPTKVQLAGAGVKRPGEVAQTVYMQTGAVATGTTTIPYDDTIPQNTEGDQYMSLAITPVSAANLLRVRAQTQLSNSAVTQIQVAALFQDAIAGALAASAMYNDSSAGTQMTPPPLIEYLGLAGTTSATTFKVRAGANGAGTTTFNGSSAARKFGGSLNSFMQIDELVG